MALSEEYRDINPSEMRGFHWFQYYIRYCDSDVFEAIKNNMKKYIDSHENLDGINVDVIIDYLTDGGTDFLSDYEMNVIFDYSDSFGEKFEHVFFPLFKKVYKKILNSKDVLLYLMFSKYSIEQQKDKYIVKEHKDDDGYPVKTFDDVIWFYDITEFQDDLFDALIQNDWEETFLQNPLLSNNIKYSYFIQEFCLNIILLNDLFIEELKNF